MKAKYQTRINPNGDCLRACIASLLEIPILSVPDFTLAQNKPDFKPGEDYEQWYLDLQAFVRKFGFAFVEIVLGGQPWIAVPLEMFAIFTGTTKSGEKHAIIGKCVDGGFLPVFDPLGPDGGPSFEAIETVALLVPTDPFAMVRMGKALEEIKRTLPAISSRILRDSLEVAVEEGLGSREYDTPTLYGADNKLLEKPQPEECREVPSLITG